MNILIADDAKEVSDFLNSFFISTGHRVFLARDGEEALKIFNQQEVEGIFCALTMPKLGGLELLKEVKLANSRLPVVIICPQHDAENALEAMQLGACDYLFKTINLDELQRTLSRVVSLHEGFHFSAYALDHLLQETRTLEIGNDFEGLNRIIAFMTQDLPSYGILKQEQLFRMNMLLKEAIENAIFHGNLELPPEMRKENPQLFYETASKRCDIEPYRNRKLILQYDLSRSSAKYVVRDEGRGFAHTDVLDPSDPDNILRNQGHGLTMIMNFMDEVFWNDRGNEVTMVRYRKRKI